MHQPTNLIIIESILPTIPGVIQTVYLDKETKKPNSSSGRIHYLGQILVNLNQQIRLTRSDGKSATTLNELNLFMPPFTAPCNGFYVQTDLSTAILNLSPSPESRFSNQAKLTKLLEPHNFTVTFKQTP